MDVEIKGKNCYYFTLLCILSAYLAWIQMIVPPKIRGATENSQLSGGSRRTIMLQVNER